jgi:Flp pilus assembly protein TadG
MITTKMNRFSSPLVRRFAGFNRWAWKETSGVAAVEFAMIVPMIMFMFLAMTDLGVGIYTDMRVNNAAQYATEYALVNGYDSNAIVNAVKSASNLTGMSVSPAQFCGCPGSTQVTRTACSASCGDGTTAGQYAQISVTDTYATIIPYPGLPASFPLSAQSTVRLQ